MALRDMTAERVLLSIIKVVQSKEAIPFDETFQIDVITVHQIAGERRSKICYVELDRL